MRQSVIIMEQMAQVAHEQGSVLAPLTDDLQYSGLNSLGFAVLIARLDDKLGFDPFTAAENTFFPVSFGDFEKLYENGAH